MDAHEIQSELERYPLPVELLNQFADVSPDSTEWQKMFGTVRRSIEKKTRPDRRSLSERVLSECVGGELAEMLLRKELRHVMRCSEKNKSTLHSEFKILQGKEGCRLGACNLRTKGEGNVEFYRFADYSQKFPLREFDALFLRRYMPDHIVLFDATTSSNVLKKKCSEENVKKFNEFCRLWIGSEIRVDLFHILFSSKEQKLQTSKNISALGNIHAVQYRHMPWILPIRDKLKKALMSVPGS